MPAADAFRNDRRDVLRGLLVGPAGHNVLRVLPPLIVEPVHIAEAVAIIRQTCSAFDGG